MSRALLNFQEPRQPGKQTTVVVILVARAASAGAVAFLWLCCGPLCAG